MNFNWHKYGIDISQLRGGKMLCPKCSHTRKNKHEKCLSVDVNTGMYNCHNNCGFKGIAIDSVPKKQYEKPQPRLEKIKKEWIDWFETKRGIDNNTLLRFGITEAAEYMPQFEKEVPVLCFNYYRDGKLVNIKFRGAQKSFKMVRGAELVFYNLDSIKDVKECVIVEGEIDCLTVHQCGYHAVVSVPNGASKGNQRLEYLDNCWQEFEHLTKIIIATDDDESGRELRNELARRLGTERCWQVYYPDQCKDANEVLLKYGKEAVNTMLAQATEWPLEAILTAADLYEQATTWYQSGYPKGAQTRIHGFNHLLTFGPGQLTTITGIPGHGKDEFTNWIMTRLAQNEDWSWAMCGFEESPAETMTKLIEKYVGKCFDYRTNPEHRMTPKEYEAGVDFVYQHFYFMNTDEMAVDIETILHKAEQLVRRKGIKGLYVNPWNWLDHSSRGNITETEYVSLSLTKILRFAKKHKVHVILIAHTTKMQKDKATNKFEVPTLYSISGSSHFYAKTHNGICVYRDFGGMNGDTVRVYTQKVKQSWMGTVGWADFKFDTFTRQYTWLGSLPTVLRNVPPQKPYNETEKDDIPF